jgi:hypothetical protein
MDKDSIDGRTPREVARSVGAEPAVFVEHAMVVAVRDIVDNGECVPVGATGTVVQVVRGGIGYAVEFTSPRHVVVSAAREELAACR